MATIALAAEPAESARAARLCYVPDDLPGIRRVRRGRGFSYLDSDGRVVRDPDTLERIRSVAIPPAWRDVWICPRADGHLQATGRDARDRKQYRYHPRWREVRDETKYERLLDFGEALPRIRRRIDADLRRPGLPREKVLAAVVRLLDQSLIRVGNEEYARSNGSYGLTTLRDHHVEIEGPNLRFSFRAKGGVRREVDVRDRRLARIIRQCREIPGQELFQYLDGDAGRQSVASDDVNAYLREAGGGDFTAKDFRTWAGTVLAATALRASDPRDSRTGTRRAIAAAIGEVAGRLGNTPAICRKCYVHPGVLTAFEEGRLRVALDKAARDTRKRGLSTSERAVLGFLRAPGACHSPRSHRRRSGSVSPLTARRRRTRARPQP